ncbi:probable membrane-associated kinase regulator 1 [Gastrolobium bilobum]|uniref:probable membrane-associated kinase regulator 1 n=1 Tax=Gastrolobium bilobum TaxID=150636 RepID=UPI002AB1CECE|nr:probable membrane-associated kinase regulator 1 [Gastrolobium bilobum]
MGKRRGKESKSYTLPPSPCHSSSSSDFEFTISISPRKSSTTLCPADELFYKGQLLPLHLSPRISMVRTLLLSSSSTSSSSTTARSSNDSQSSFNSDLAILPDCDSSRPSSVTEDDEFKRLHNPTTKVDHQPKKTHKYFSFSRFSSVFRKENAKTRDPENVSGSSVKRMSATAKEVIRKYLKKVKPLYEKLSQKQQQQQQQRTGDLMMMEGTSTTTSVLSLLTKTERSTKETEGSGKRGRKETMGVLSHSFSGNLRYPRRRSCVSSCPSSMRSSPSHSGVLSQRGVAGAMYNGDASSMEELQSAIQGAIAHCKNSLIQNKTVVSNEI